MPRPVATVLGEVAGDRIEPPVWRHAVSPAGEDGRQSASTEARPVADRGAAVEERPTAVPPSGSAGLFPVQPSLRIYARILLHIARQPRYAPSETVPDELTQSGMAAALGTSQGAVSNALKRLLDGGAVRVERSHVRHRLQRLKVYQLTDDGETLVRHIREGMGSPPG